MALRTVASTTAACSRPSPKLLAARSSSTCRPSTLAVPAVAAAVFTLPKRAFATVACAPAKDLNVADDALMNRDEQR